MVDTMIKCVSLGDGAVGKTCLLISFAQNKFPEDHIPTVFDNYLANVLWKQNTVSLGLWDTAGQEEYEGLRVLSLPDTDVFLICYSVVNPVSYSNVKNVWAKEVKKNCPQAPIILVGTKLDLREDEKVLKEMANNGEKPITQDMGEQLQKEIGAEYFVECSALTQKNVKECFHFAIEAVLEPIKKKETKKPTIFSSVSQSTDTEDIDNFLKKKK